MSVILIKRCTYSLKHRSAIQRRLESLKKNPLPNTARMVDFYWIDPHMIELHLEYLPGQTLSKFLECANDELKNSAFPILLKKLRAQKKLWKKERFIHGDLSLSNILIDQTADNNYLQLYFIDWLIDLKSFQATPKYASFLVLLGLRNWMTEAHAFHRIEREILRHCIKECVY